MTLGSAGSIPASAVDFGAGLRRLRVRGLRRLQIEQEKRPDLYAVVISKSQLARYESGQVLPPLEYAEHLDLLYEARGWVDMSLRTLWRSRWDPWADDQSRLSSMHAGSWPAQFSGLVWIKVWPSAQTVDQEVEISLHWGSWQQKILLKLPKEGQVLITGKAVDEGGASVTLNLVSNLEVFTLFGAGDVTNEGARSIAKGWALKTE